MKTKILLFLCALTVSTILSAATITVTNNLASGSGSLAAAVDLATSGMLLVLILQEQTKSCCLK